MLFSCAFLACLPAQVQRLYSYNYALTSFALPASLSRDSKRQLAGRKIADAAMRAKRSQQARPAERVRTAESSLWPGGLATRTCESFSPARLELHTKLAAAGDDSTAPPPPPLVNKSPARTAPRQTRAIQLATLYLSSPKTTPSGGRLPEADKLDGALHRNRRAARNSICQLHPVRCGSQAGGPKMCVSVAGQVNQQALYKLTRPPVLIQPLNATIIRQRQMAIAIV